MYPSKKTGSCKQFVATLTFATVIALLIVLLNDALLVVYFENQNHKLTQADSDLAHDTQVGNDDLKTTMEEQLRKLESNFTARLLELGRHYSEELRGMKEALNATEERLANATVMIVELEEENLSTFKVMQEALNQLREINSAAIEAVERELNATRAHLDHATIRITDLEVELMSTNAEVASLDTSKASVVTVSELSATVAQLEVEKASKTEFDSLSTNLTLLAEASSMTDNEIRLELDELADSSLNQTHHDQLEEFIAIFASTKANQSNFEHLVERVTTLENTTNSTAEELYQAVGEVENTAVELQLDLEQLSITVTGLAADTNTSLASKADQQEVDSLSDQLTQLATLTVERGEFEDLTANLASLREATARADQELRKEIDDLADGTINRTHHDELQDIVNMFAATKANQSDFEALQAKVAILSEDMQSSIDTLNHNITSLKRDIQVGERDIAELNGRVATLEGVLDVLEQTVDSLKRGKANATELEDLQEKEKGLDDRVTTHISSSQATHEGLSSDITWNEGAILSMSDRISSVETSISDLETQVSDSTQEIRGSYVTTVISVLVTLVAVFTIYTN